MVHISFRQIMIFPWDSCIIYQKGTSAELRCPLRSYDSTLDESSVYSLFLQNVSKFYSLDSLPFRDCMVAHTIVNLEAFGKTQYTSFFNAVIKDRRATIGNALNNNKPKLSKTIYVLKSDVALFAKLYITMQSRDANLEDIFNHEAQPPERDFHT